MIRPLAADDMPGLEPGGESNSLNVFPISGIQPPGEDGENTQK